METHEPVDAWVNHRVRVPELPANWPDVPAAWQRLDERIARRSRNVWIWAAAAAAVCAAVLVPPSTRAIAQRLWDQVMLGRFQLLVADYDGGAVSAFTAELRHRPEARPVPSLEAATRAAGFAPRLPVTIFPSAPSYSVTAETSATLTLRTAAIRYFLAQAGGSRNEVPDEWDGVTLDVRLGPVVIADYDGTLLVQSRPFRLITPAGFDLELLYRIAFRSLGMSAQAAAALSTDMAFSPALLTLMPKEDRNLLREFSTPGGTGVMVADVYGKGTITALWSGSDRLYVLFGTIDEDLVTRVANALE